MKKMLYLAAFAGVALASCTSEDYLGSEPSAPQASLADGIIGFQSAGTRNLTRASLTGADAAAKLGNEFRVLGTITKNGTTSEVFNNYVVKYDETQKGATNPDGSLKDSTNVYGWYYLGLKSKPAGTDQYIKYWDLNAQQYDFIAFSGIDDAVRVASTEQNELQLDRTNMQKVYMSDKVIATYTGAEGVMYGNKVGFTFSRAAARMRVGFYETVPGYAVANLRFYFDDNLTSTNTNLATDDVKMNGTFPTSGKYVISYDKANKYAPVANYQVQEGQSDPSFNFGKLQYKQDETGNLTISADGKQGVVAAGAGEAKFLATSSAQPTWAKTSATLDGENVTLSDWQSIMPYPAYGAKAGEEYINRRIRIRVDYDLVPLDGGPVINVYNASAVIPYTWSQWQSNYAYTYIFKITDTTSGSTIPPYVDPKKDTDGDGIPDIDDPDDDNDGIPDDEDPDHVDPTPENPDITDVPDPDQENPNPNKPAVSPIVFDATVSEITDFNQETITGVTSLGGNAITTYSATSNVTNANEYKVGETIQVGSPSHGRWGVAFTTSAITEQAVADNNTYVYTFLAGEATADETIDQRSEYQADFQATEAGYYIVWLRYLPTGMQDVDGNYVDVFKVVKVVQ